MDAKGKRQILKKEDLEKRSQLYMLLQAVRTAVNMALHPGDEYCLGEDPWVPASVTNKQTSK